MFHGLVHGNSDLFQLVWVNFCESRPHLTLQSACRRFSKGYAAPKRDRPQTAHKDLLCALLGTMLPNMYGFPFGGAAMPFGLPGMPLPGMPTGPPRPASFRPGASSLASAYQSLCPRRALLLAAFLFSQA